MRRMTVLLLLAFGAFMALTSCGASSDEPTNAAIAASRLDPTGAVVLDVRTPAEFDSGHLIGAVNINVQSASFTAEIAQFDPNGRYLVYCRSGNRSKVAIDIMRSLGFADVVDLGSVAQASSATGLRIT